MDRRSFFLAGGAAALAGAAPSDQHAMGLVGAGGRGQYLLKLFLSNPGVLPAGICDVYEPNLEKGLSLAGNQARAYRNYKALLENKDIELVVIATPEHWHHRMVLDAIAAGKDVYVEKPLCQTPEQGAELVDAAARSKSIVQVGTQRRSYDLFLKARQLVAGGTLGPVRMVRSWWLNNQVQPAPPRKLDGPLDWEQWQGPAARRPLDPARFFRWRIYSEYSGGIMADQGAHVFDGIHMLMGAGYPVAVNATAGKPHVPGVDTPDCVVVTAEYPEDFVAVFSINYAAMRYKPRNDQLNQFDGDQARLDIGRESFSVYKRGEEDKAAITETSGGFDKATEAHVANFLECVRTRKTPNAPVEKGFQGALIVQMANLALEHGKRLRLNNQTKKVEA